MSTQEKKTVIPPTAEEVRDLVSRRVVGYHKKDANPIANESRFRCFFITFPHPQEQIDSLTDRGFLTPEETVDFVLDYLTHAHKPSFKNPKDSIASLAEDDDGNTYVRYKVSLGEEIDNVECGVNFEVSGDTRLKHLHVSLYYKNPRTLEQIRQILYPFRCHIEDGKGNRRTVLSYMNKEGKYAEKGTVVVVQPRWKGDFRTGENVFDEIDRLIDEGKTPEEITNMGARFAARSNAIMTLYCSRMASKVPITRDVYTEYHFGKSGSGKTTACYKIADGMSDRPIANASDFNRVGYSVSAAYKTMFDEYLFQPLLILNEFRDTSMKWNMLLAVLDNKTEYVTARYTNKTMAWTRVAINSVHPLENLYRSMTSDDEEFRNRDGSLPSSSDMTRRYENRRQLWRRINKVVYHFTDDFYPVDDERHYCSVELEGDRVMGVADVYQGEKQMRDMADEFLRERHPGGGYGVSDDDFETGAKDDEPLDLGALEEYETLFKGAFGDCVRVSAVDAPVSPQKPSQGVRRHSRLSTVQIE